MSIEARELRLGNWVETYSVVLSGAWYDDKGNKHGTDVLTEPAIRRKQIDIEDLKIISEAHGLLATYRGIPISPEILSKCGLQKSNGINPHYSDGSTMIIWRTEYESDELENYFYYEFGITKSFGAIRQIRLGYLHQLQNLYFALTNKELEIQSFLNEFSNKA